MSKDTTQAVQIIKPAKLAIIPKLKSGDDKEVAERLIKNHDAACDATKVIFDTGLYCFHVKSQLKHGEFGPWLQAHLPERMWRLNDKGKPTASPTLSWQMGFTQDFVEKCKMTVEKVLAQIPKAWEFAKTGKCLQIAEKSPLLLEAPAKITEFYQKGTEMVKGKSAYQLCIEFKQGEQDGDGNIKTKRGRLTGHGGASKEQRAAAAERDEQARIDALELSAEEFADWVMENADDKNIGQISDRIQRKLATACALGTAYLKNVAEARKQK